jgi:D-alanyl-D-alanine carboxypeptidase
MGCGQAMDSEAVARLDPTLRAIAMQVIQQSGGAVGIGSGWRSNQQQASLYNRWVSGQYDVPAVAKPGTSHHETGNAIDFCGDLRLAQQIGRGLGLVFPVRGEAWHGELGEGVQAAGEPNFGEMGIQYNLNYTGGGRPVDPKEVIANRMNAIMSSLGSDQFTSGATQMMDPLAQAQQYIAPSTETQGMSEVIDPNASAGLPEAGARTTQPLAPSQYTQPRVSGSNLQDMSVTMEPGGDRAQLGAYAQSLFGQFGFKPEDYPALVALWNKESGDPRAGSSRVTWNPLAQNPTSTAFGIAQFLNGTWAGTGVQKTTNPQQQILAGLTYIKGRYGSPANALAFHNRNNWY